MTVLAAIENCYSWFHWPVSHSSDTMFQSRLSVRCFEVDADCPAIFRHHLALTFLSVFIHYELI